MIVALVWTALFHLNDFFFNAAEVAPLVSLIFLPAVLRPVAVLLFGIPGAVGLMLGSALTIPTIETLNVSLVLTILSNGLVAWVVLAFMRLMPIYRSELTADMSGLTLRTVIVLVSLTALVSSLTNSFIFFTITRSLRVFGSNLIYACRRYDWRAPDALFTIDIFAACF